MTGPETGEIAPRTFYSGKSESAFMYLILGDEYMSLMNNLS